jgi:hypothetical protein
MDLKRVMTRCKSRFEESDGLLPLLQPRIIGFILCKAGRLGLWREISRLRCEGITNGRARWFGRFPMIGIIDGWRVGRCTCRTSCDRSQVFKHFQPKVEWGLRSGERLRSSPFSIRKDLSETEVGLESNRLKSGRQFSFFAE